jgi:hypothetical protein
MPTPLEHREAMQGARCRAGSALGGGEWSGRTSGKGVVATAAPKAERAYSEATLRSLENIEEAQLNYDLVRATMFVFGTEEHCAQRHVGHGYDILSEEFKHKVCHLTAVDHICAFASGVLAEQDRLGCK